MKDKKKDIDPQKIREILITVAILLSYVTFTSMGIIIQKYHPWVGYNVDYIIFPLSFAFILFIYIFQVTYEKRQGYILDKETTEIVKMYGEMKSFSKVVEELSFVNHPEEVRQAIIKFCRLRGNF